MKHILLTGANSYIGRLIIKYLSQINEYQIITLTRELCDLTVYKDVKNYFSSRKFDYVIHCAAEGKNTMNSSLYKIFYSNIAMVDNIIRNSNSYYKLLLFGSGAEHCYKRSVEPYGFSKRIISKLIYGLLNVTQYRIWNVFNHNLLLNRFIKSNILRCLRGLDLIIDQDMYFDFFHMEDLMIYVKGWLDGTLFHNNEFNCVYKTSKKLSLVALYIRNNINEGVNIDIINKLFDNIGYCCRVTNEQYSTLDCLYLRILQTIKNIREDNEICNK